MTTKTRLIIVSPRQYGYQTDYLKYAEYLVPYYNVVFLCLDQGEKRFENGNISLKYTCAQNKKIAYLLFFLKTYFYIMTHKGIVMSTNFKGCRYLKELIPWRKMAINIRTVSIDKDDEKSAKQNIQILEDAKYFDRIIMISEGGARQLRLPLEKTSIVSLGADVISHTNKMFDSLRMLYVGTLNNRDIIKTVIGFHQYLEKSGDTNAIYDIVGNGEEFSQIKEYVETEKLEKRIILHGQKKYDELKPFFDKCNVGVAFVPITPMYDYQPPTKTFEYLNSGLFCIATDTTANRNVITATNGCLIQDTANDFCSAIQLFMHKRQFVSSSQIRKTGRPYLWKTIIEQQLLPALQF